MFEELNQSFSYEEISTAISQLKHGRSCGPDGLINEFYIYGKTELIPVLLVLFNKIFEIGHFPEGWSEGYIIPLHKKGSINNPENYRGITLLSTLGKLFSRVLNNRLSSWAENYSVYIESQTGFRKNMGTVDNIFVLHGLITHMLNAGKKLYCGFIDFTKAFDYVVRENLWTKLIKIGLRGNILNIIKAMYKGIKSKVKYLNRLSNEFYCDLGVRQGECLSPFLFSMFLNDIEEQFILKSLDGVDIGIIKLFVLLYADDMVIFSESAEGLQKGFDVLADYCNRWKVKVNTNKTKVVIFRKGGILPRNLKFTFEGKDIQIVKSFSYLGIVLTQGAAFTEAQKTLAGQAQKAIFKLNTYLYHYTNITVKHKLDLFDKLVLPILNYSCEVWGFIPALSIERVHTRFCKQALGVKISTQNDFVYGELGRRNLIVQRHFKIIKYWLKVVQLNENKLVKCIYNMMLQDLELFPNKTNWALLVRDLLASLGFFEVWLEQSVGDINFFLSFLKQRLNDAFIQNWHARLENSTRALFYRNFCYSSFGFRAYLNHVNLSKFRNALSRLRVSSHNLEIEAGRWHKPVSKPFSERICLICSTLEDEYHFVLVCSLYQDLRKLYINKYYWKRPNMYKFIELMSNENVTTLKNLSVYVYKAFKIRNDTLYDDG